jgi:hypothetical protein
VKVNLASSRLPKKKDRENKCIFLPHISTAVCRRVSKSVEAFSAVKITNLSQILLTYREKGEERGEAWGEAWMLGGKEREGDDEGVSE